MNKTKKILLTFSIMCLLFFSISFFSACSGKVNKESESQKPIQTIKIGVSLCLTGGASDYGQKALNGIKMGFDEFQLQHPDKKISLKIQDTKSNPKDAVFAIRNLISQENLKIVIGDVMSSTTLAMIPILKDKHVLLFAPGASSPELRNKGDYFLRNWASDDFNGMIMAEYIFSKAKISRIGVFYIANDYGIGLKNAFVNNYKGSIDLIESFNQDENLSLRNLAVKLKSKKEIKGVYLIGHSKENGYLVKAIRELGIEIPIFANLVVESMDFRNIVGKYSDGITFSTPAFDISDETKNVKNFVTNYKEKYGEEPESAAAHGFDAAKILAEAFAAGNFSPQEIREYILKLIEFKGVTGDMKFLPNCDVLKDVLIKKFEGDHIVILEKFKISSTQKTDEDEDSEKVKPESR